MDDFEHQESSRPLTERLREHATTRDFIDDSPEPERGSFEWMVRHVKLTPPEFSGAPQLVAAYLGQAAESEAERAMAAYCWVARHIMLDTPVWFGAAADAPDVEKALSTRRAGPEGFAALFVALCEALDIDARAIHGRVNQSRRPDEDNSEEPTPHVWAAARVNGRWLLADPTLGAGYVNARHRFVRRFQPAWFAPDPVLAAYVLFPDDPAWRLLAPPEDRESFPDKDFLKPGFFSLGAVLISHGEPDFESGSYAMLEIEAPERCVMDGRIEGLRPAPGNEEHAMERVVLPRDLIFAQRKGARIHVYALFPRQAVFRVLVTGREPNGPEIPVAAWRVRATEAAAASDRFPLQGASYASRGVLLREPLAGRLPVGRETKFMIKIPGAEWAALRLDGKNGEDAPLSKERDLFHTAYVPETTGDLTLVAGFGDSWEEILRYKVVNAR